MTGFALYRLPHATQAVLVAQDSDAPISLPSCQAVTGRQGFIIAPFDIAKHPVVLIRPDILKHFDTKDVRKLDKDISACIRYTTESTPVTPATRADYSSDFTCFHRQLDNGTFRKIVLSRCLVLPRKKEDSPHELFIKACQHYPRLFIALVYTPQSGLWLTATPEILLEGKQSSHEESSQWRTIALAGTMKLKARELTGEGEHTAWSTKDIQEQRYVATYLQHRLEAYVNACSPDGAHRSVCEEGPRTVRAANLVHLRSDFSFTLGKSPDIGALLHTLQPTPAVCGLPKEAAYNFIRAHEHTPRRYYSGFMGPIGLSQAANPSTDFFTHLYVSLRCMRITASHYHLYAGGGLLADSREEQEWQETEAKLDTMRKLLKHTS